MKMKKPGGTATARTLFLEAVTDGNADEALRLNRIMDQDAGRLSSSDCGHWKPSGRYQELRFRPALP